MAIQLTYKEFMDALENDNRLLGIKCNDCGAYTFPPIAVCQECGSDKYEAAELSGRGIVKSFTVIRVPPEGFSAGYTVGLVELTEGPWIMVNIQTDEPDMSLIGKKGTVSCIVSVGDKFSGGKRAVFVFSLD